jgi:hypothetical protein
MVRQYEYDLVDGVETPPLVVSIEGALPSGHHGTIHVESVRVTLDGVHQGTLALHDGAQLVLAGTLQGTLSVEPGCTARIPGTAQGEIYVAPGAVVVIERSGQHQGGLTNDGSYTLYGTRGGSLRGSGTYAEAAGSVVKQPTVRDGVAIYEWLNYSRS